MGTQLSSLRVDATLDASQWTQGANQITTANAQAAQSANDLAASLDAVNGKLSSSQFINGYGAQFQQSVDAASNSGHGFISTLAELSSIVGLAAKGIALFATSGVAQMAALGGSFALAGTAFQNSFARTVATGTADTLAAIALPLRGFAAIGAGILAMDAITKLGIDQMNDLVSIAGKAQTAGVSPSFFQQETKAADDFNVSADDAAKALDAFFKATQPNGLNGSALDQTLQTLEKAGNFLGDSGLAQYDAATTVEQKWAAISTLITQATAQGQRLAAIDLAKTFLPDSMLQKLEATGDFLQTWQKAAADVTPPFSDADVAQAVRMNAALTDAENTINEKWKPVMDDLATVGVGFEQTWISIVQLMAQASAQIPTMYSGLKGAFDYLSGVVTTAEGFIGKLGNMFPDMSGTFLEPKGPQTLQSPLSTAFGEVGAGLSPQLTQNLIGALQQLATKLTLPGSTQQAELGATNMEYSLLGDTSNTGADPAAATNARRDAYDRLTTTLEKNTLANLANIATVGQSAAATAGLKAEFDLLEAAMTANHGVTQDQITSYVALRATMDSHQAMDAAGITLNAKDAASFDRTTASILATTQALEKVKTDDTISFQGSLLGLSDNDATIVNQLTALYGHDIPAAMNSSEFATLQMQQYISQFKTGAEAFSSTLLSGLQQGKTIADSLSSALTSAANQFANAIAKNGMSAISGSIGNAVGSLFNAGTGDGVDPAAGGGGISSLLSSNVGTGLLQLGVGTVLSLVTGSITASEQAQQAFAQAQTDWANMAEEIAEFVCAMMSSEDHPAQQSTEAAILVDERAPTRKAPEVIQFPSRRKQIVGDQFRLAS